MSMSSTCNAYELVEDFYVKNNLGIYNGRVSPELWHCRARMVLEELGELAVATHDQHEHTSACYDHNTYRLPIGRAARICGRETTLVNIADALADLLYVVVGTAVSCTGLPVRDHWYGTQLTWPPVQLLAQLADQAAICFYHFTLQPEVVTRKLDNLARTICQAACGATFHPRGLPFELIFREVHRSNMTKEFGTVAPGEKGDRSSKNYKGPNYTPPNLEELIHGLRTGASGD